MGGTVHNMQGGAGGGIKLVSISIKTPPAKTTYTAGETFDPAGMVVEAVYSNGATADATGYAYIPSTALTDGTASVTIQYTEAGVTKTATQAITVVHRLESISILTQPTKISYEYGDSFSSAGMVVRAAYSDGTTADVTGYSCFPQTLNNLGAQTITVSYTERGITKTVTMAVTVERKSISTPPSQAQALTYNGSPQSPTWDNYDAAQLTMGGVTTGTNAGNYDATFTPTANFRWADGTTDAKTVGWTIGKAVGSLSISPASLALDTANPAKAITVTRPGDGAISAVSSNTGVATVNVSGNTVTVTGKGNGAANITISVGAGTNHNAPASKVCAVEVSFTKIYGVQWDGTAATTWSRTDAAETFTNPSPAVNNGTGSSPFDNLLPWSGMVKETIDGNVLVKIPKYYYKWTRSGATMKLQIADGPEDGFHVSPAHADRGDGKGERDYVYVGRYHCNSSYKSAAGAQPLGSITRAAARTNIHNLGATYWQYDYAMYWTIMMLYLVEYANWNSQATIGYGCSAGGSKFNMGATDAMTYHTGTTAANRTTYGSAQYRWIEGLWDNVYDWCDGIYFSGPDVYCIKNPASFSDTTGGTLVGYRFQGSGYISAWTNPTAAGFEYALYPAGAAGSETTYVCDYCNYSASGVVLAVGGNYGQYQNRGAFCLYGNYAASSSYSAVGCRLQKLP